MNSLKLSVIIPFRCETESTHHLLLRLEDLLSQKPNQDTIEFIVVDSGSLLKFQEECREICNKHKVKYLYHDSEGKVFSIGECRDFGVQYAKGKAITFLDVDLRVSSDFWGRLLILMESWGISKYKKSILSIPCLYLTQEGTTEFLENKSDNKFVDFYLRYLQGDKQSIESLALCSSVMIVDRNHYLSVGGHDVDFRGHGYEDFELYHRLLSEEGIIPKPENYFLDQKTWDTYTYSGFRSHLAMTGRPALSQGLLVVHLWHPRPKNTSFYFQKGLSQNRTRWEDKFKQFIDTGNHPLPLVDSTKLKKKVLFWGQPHTNASNCLKDVFPFMGNVLFLSEYSFQDKYGEFLEEDFSEMLSNEGISKIIFPNPYGNMARLAIYQWCRKTGFPYYCFERGALPDSWFFDKNGFNADSDSYSEKYWNKSLSLEQLDEVKKYIQDTLSGEKLLEKQSVRLGGEGLSNKLRIGGKKVLFVPLQRPSDTVIKYMCGNIQNYQRFMELIDELARLLESKGWVVLCKKHPLETESPNLKFAQYVPEETNFIDLLELADSVALINSGVGIYSMMMEKPTYIFGDAFYTIDGVNTVVPYIDLSDRSAIAKLAREIAENKKIVNRDKMYRFIYYLIYQFYSFGEPKTKIRKEADGSLRNLTTNIDFYRLNLDSKTIFEYESSKRPVIDILSPIFERYRLDIHQKRKQKQEQVKVVKKNTSSPKPIVPNAKSEVTEVKAVPQKENKMVPSEKGIDVVKRKFSKLRKDPKKFFMDSKYFKFFH